jgi:small-conductance mechanosensitive channel
MFNKLGLGVTITENLIKTAAIMLVAFLLRLAAEFVIRAILNKFRDDNPMSESLVEKRAYTISSIIKNAVNAGIIAVTFLTILSAWGINIMPLLAGAGILGLAVGFGSQQIVRDVVNGFFIIIENTYNVGDEVEVAGKKGRVEAMNLRTTLLLDRDGNRFTIPNSSISIVQIISHKKDIKGDD